MFKLGDRVRALSTGDTGSVTEIRADDMVGVRMDYDGLVSWFSAGELAGAIDMAQWQSARALQEHAAQYAARTVTSDAMLAYAHDAGLFRSTLEHVRKQLGKLRIEEEQLTTEHVYQVTSWCQQAITDALASARTQPGPEPREGKSSECVTGF